MGIKLEWLLVLLIGGMLSVTYMVRFSDEDTDGRVSGKEMEFTRTVFTEVDTKAPISTAFGRYGKREEGILTIRHLVYHNASIEHLASDRARYVGEKIYLDGTIMLRQKQGFTYRTEHAVYHQKRGLLSITAPFVASMGKNMLQGSSALYDTRRKVFSAKRVKAVVYMAEKE